MSQEASAATVFALEPPRTTPTLTVDSLADALWAASMNRARAQMALTPEPRSLPACADPAVRGDVELARALAARDDRVVGPPSLEDEACSVAAADLLQDPPAIDGSGLLVGDRDHRERHLRERAGIRESGQRGADHGQPSLHVEHSRPAENGLLPAQPGERPGRMAVSWWPTRIVPPPRNQAGVVATK